MNEFTPWTLFVDIGIVSILLLIGKLMRVKIKLIQKLFIPPSILAGFMGLILGTGGFNLIPLSQNCSTYAGILIALIFGALPLTFQKNKENKLNIGSLWAYSQGGMFFQWAFGGLLGLLVLNQIWELDPAFGITLPAGFCGGHGTAAAIGQTFKKFGHNEIMSLAMTSATIGILSAIVLGLIIIKWANQKGYTSFLPTYKDLPQELRTGLLPIEKREKIGESTCSSISIDSLTFNVIIVVAIALGGYGMSKIITSILSGFELPVFSCAFIVGILIKLIFDKTSVSNYVCPQTIKHISGTFTDFLIAFGIASIKISIVVKYIIPLVILLTTGLIVTFIYVFIIPGKWLKEFWFEKAIFTWGWLTGTMANGIALLRVVDPKMQSYCLDSYAIAYLFIAPVEISLITFAPIIFVNGYGLIFSIICLVLCIAILLIAYFKKWFITKII
ncbi:MAG TPA: sodium:glutamate symporter [Paludibacteraceae bacterium]|nr:sodium:glutamate symporter [Paludibacteraceae bacterium]